MPGHALTWRAGESSVGRYFDPLSPGRPVQWLSDPEVEQFGEMLDQSVTRCLEISPAAIFLSGGLDSVSVAAVAADASARMGLPPPLALSLRFPHPDVDEADIQRRVAAQLGLPLVLLDLEEAVGPEGIFPAGLELCRTWPAPQLNPWLPAYCRLALEGRDRGRGVRACGLSLRTPRV